MTIHFQQQGKKVAEVVSRIHDAESQFQKGFYARVGKRVLDLAIVLTALPFVIPILAIAAIANAMSGHRVLYSQQRLGQHGRVFRIWKLSSMRENADQMLDELLRDNPDLRHEWQTTQKLKNDPRVTRVGTVLRRTSMDEIPQLFNVLKGDMSLLGPRPMMLDQVEIYGPTLPVYLSLRPGISGKWQVSERNDAHFRRRAQIDAEYARDLSLKNDLVLVWETLRTLIRSTGY